MDYHLLISDLPEGERPRERMLQVGASGLSHRELIAILLRLGTRKTSVLALADQLLHKFGGLSGIARASLSELQSVPGVGKVKAIELKTALELGKRMTMSAPDERPIIKTPNDAAQLLMADMSLLDQEEVRTLLLDTRNRVLAAPMIYRGSINSSGIKMGELFREAIRANAASLIAAHNHPSGDPSPSAEDVRATRQMIDTGKLLGIEFLDHIIIGHNAFVSMKERRLGFG